MLRDRRSSQNFIRVIKFRRMVWAKHVARMGERRAATDLRCGNLREGENFEDQGVRGGE
jgi:hypothetical protein